MDIPIKILVTRNPDGRLTAEVPGMPGCITEGDSPEHLRAMVREALTGWLRAEQDDAIRRAGADPEYNGWEVMTL
ncbi:MAG TPA: hypothetical protein VG406_27625 [Isosphaeraceae bacterium]|jgi:predicted RNase H-like HicB family nuclease|nr:hypothetical protein [Isosphaeraceae bacterium]